jgi:glycosyltransferase involved in cell wall biosynthesis
VSLRVLMLNRSDAFTVSGGDTVLMLETKAGLEKLGVRVEVDVGDTSRSTQAFDLVHVFNCDQLERFLGTSPSSPRRHGPPIVLSPLFWFDTGHWFDAAVVTRRRWRLAGRALGLTRSRHLYELWQTCKFRYGGAGRRLRHALAQLARILPDSRAQIAHLQAMAGLPDRLGSRCTIVPNAVRRDLFEPRPAPNAALAERYGTETVVLQVSRIQAAKNQLRLIEALHDVPVRLVFVGQPSPYEPAYVERCHQAARARGQVSFLGVVPTEELLAIYGSSAVHVLPSWRELPGLASLEAAAAGCRIVSTSIGSAREYFGDHAWYCDPGDVQSIRRAVLAALRASPSATLRSLILARYTWDAAAAATLEAYRLAVADRPAA